MSFQRQTQKWRRALLEFMLIAAPRSATTWAANWLTTDTTLCLHDPLWTRKRDELDSIRSKKTLGIACTGSFVYVDWLNKHPARKVIVHRDIDDINNSLTTLALPTMQPNDLDKLDAVRGAHVHYNDLFDDPKRIYEYLLQKPFDEERHVQLVDMEIQPFFAKLKIGKEATAKFVADLRGI